MKTPKDLTERELRIAVLHVGYRVFLYFLGIQSHDEIIISVRCGSRGLAEQREENIGCGS